MLLLVHACASGVASLPLPFALPCPLAPSATLHSPAPLPLELPCPLAPCATLHSPLLSLTLAAPHHPPVMPAPFIQARSLLLSKAVASRGVESDQLKRQLALAEAAKSAAAAERDQLAAR